MRISSHRQFIDGLAAAALALLGQGRVAPTAPEIASERWQDAGGVPKVLLEEVRRRLPEIRGLLRDQGHTVVPVSERYYRLRRSSNIGDRDISACLAIGRGCRQVGILFITDSDDLAKRINVAHETWVHGSGAGKADAARTRIGVALEDGLITQGEALEALTFSGGVAELDLFSTDETDPDGDTSADGEGAA